MPKKVRSYRLQDSVVNKLEKLLELEQERVNLMTEKMNVKDIILSSADLLTILIEKEYKRLKEEGYDL